MSRLTLLQINIIGAVVAVIVGLALYFTIITNAMKDRDDKAAALKLVEDRASKLSTAQNALKRAQEDEKRTKIDWAVYEPVYMPIVNHDSNRVNAMMKDWWPNNGKSFPERFMAGFRKHMADQAKSLKIAWLNPDVVAFPSFGPDPNAIDMGDTGTLKFGPYQMQVQGRNYQSLMAHIKSWNKIRLIGAPVVEGVTLTGNSPNLFAAYTVTFTLILHETMPGKISRIGGSGGSQGGGGGGGRGMSSGGGGGMMMGGPGISSGGGGMGSGGGGMGSGGAGMGSGGSRM